MPIQTTRRATAIVAAAGTLLLAAFAVAPQADAATLYACVKKNGTAHIYSKKPKCRKHETKLSWNTEGLAGKNGTNGLNGTNGINGANGTNGTNGKDLTSHTPLPSGQSESGAFAVGTGSSASGFVSLGISFSQPLAKETAENHVLYNSTGATSASCPGVGRAAPGFVCLYEAENAGLSFFDAFGFAGEGKSNYASTYGFSVYFSISSAGFVDGSWTVTGA